MHALLKELTCECGFLARDADERELLQLAQLHMRETHNAELNLAEALHRIRAAA